MPPLADPQVVDKIEKALYQAFEQVYGKAQQVSIQQAFHEEVVIFYGSYYVILICSRSAAKSLMLYLEHNPVGI